MDTRLLHSIDLSPPFTAAQAHGDGLSDYDLRRFVQRGRIVRRRRGVFVGTTYAKQADADPRTSHALDVAALRLALSYHLVAVGPSAARIHGLEFYKPPPPRIHVVTTDPRAVPLVRDGYDLRRRDLPPDDVVETYGLQVTTPLRTFVDVAPDLDFVNGTVFTDSGLHKQLFDTEALLARLDDPYARHYQHLRALIDFADARSESPLESAGRATFHVHKIAPPLLQVWLLAGIRVDFFWPQFRTVAEADGMLKYLLGGPEQVRRTIEEERERQRAIEAAHFAVFRFGWDDLAEPAKLVAGLEETFERGLSLG